MDDNEGPAGDEGRPPERSALSDVSEQIARNSTSSAIPAWANSPGRSRSHPGYISKDVFVAERYPGTTSSKQSADADRDKYPSRGGDAETQLPRHATGRFTEQQRVGRGGGDDDDGADEEPGLSAIAAKCLREPMEERKHHAEAGQQPPPV
jgi:hypothetical protein